MKSARGARGVRIETKHNLPFPPHQTRVRLSGRRDSRSSLGFPLEIEFLAVPHRQSHPRARIPVERLFVWKAAVDHLPSDRSPDRARVRAERQIEQLFAVAEHLLAFSVVDNISVRDVSNTML